MDAAIVDVERAVFDQLTRRHDRTSAVLGRSLWAAEGGSVRWQSSSMVALGRSLEVDAADGDLSVRLEVVPTFDPGTGELTLGVDATSTEGTDRRSVRTTVPVPLLRGGAVLKIAGASTGERMRVLVLLPRRY